MTPLRPGVIAAAQLKEELSTGYIGCTPYHPGIFKGYFVLQD